MDQDPGQAQHVLVIAGGPLLHGGPATPPAARSAMAAVDARRGPEPCRHPVGPTRRAPAWWLRVAAVLPLAACGPPPVADMPAARPAQTQASAHQLAMTMLTLEGKVLANLHDCVRDGVCALQLDVGGVSWRVIYQAGDVEATMVRPDLVRLAWGIQPGEQVRVRARPAGAAASVVLDGPQAALERLGSGR